MAMAIARAIAIYILVCAKKKPGSCRTPFHTPRGGYEMGMKREGVKWGMQLGMKLGDERHMKRGGCPVGRP